MSDEQQVMVIFKHSGVKGDTVSPGIHLNDAAEDIPTILRKFRFKFRDFLKKEIWNANVAAARFADFAGSWQSWPGISLQSIDPKDIAGVPDVKLQVPGGGCVVVNAADMSWIGYGGHLKTNKHYKAE